MSVKIELNADTNVELLVAQLEKFLMPERFKEMLANGIPTAGEITLIGADTVTISKKEYDELQDESAMLAALDAAGVDNWSGYDDALNMLAEWEEEDNQR